VISLAEKLSQFNGDAADTPLWILLDSRSAQDLIANYRNLVANLDIVNPRLLTRPLYLFESAIPLTRISGGNVGYLDDPEIAQTRVETLLSDLIGKTVHAVPFRTPGQLGRCLREGAIPSNSTRFGCPTTIGWAAIAQGDASSDVSNFRNAYRDTYSNTTDRIDIEQVRITRVRTQLIERVGIPEADVAFFVWATQEELAGLPGDPTYAGSLAAMLRKEGTLTSDSSMQPLTGLAAFMTPLWSLFVKQVQAQSNLPPLGPYPVVLTNRRSGALRQALADGYLDALGRWINPPTVTPCEPIPERVQRAYLLDAFKQQPPEERMKDKTKTLSLASKIFVSRGLDDIVRDLLKTIQVPDDVERWPDQLSAAASCPVPDVRGEFSDRESSPYVAAVRELEWARNQGRSAADRRQHLANAAACLVRAAKSDPKPKCYKGGRSGYQFGYYDPYFYFAVQKASGGRDVP
jgi:hypothetical protein